MLIDRKVWTRRAACRGMDVNRFFPVEADRGEGGKSGKEQAAKAVCAGCPVRRECLNEALRIPDLQYGIRGGLTPYERRSEARRRARGRAAA